MPRRAKREPDTVQVEQRRLRIQAAERERRALEALGLSPDVEREVLAAVLARLKRLRPSLYNFVRGALLELAHFSKWAAVRGLPSDAQKLESGARHGARDATTSALIGAE